MTESRLGHRQLPSSGVRWACLLALSVVTLFLALARSDSGGAQEPAGSFNERIAVTIEPGVSAQFNYVVVHTWDFDDECTPTVLGEVVTFEILTPAGAIFPDVNGDPAALLGIWTSKAADVFTFDTDGANSSLTVQPVVFQGECQAWINVSDDSLDYIDIKVTVYDPDGPWTTWMVINNYTPTPSPSPTPTPTPSSTASPTGQVTNTHTPSPPESQTATPPVTPGATPGAYYSPTPEEVQIWEDLTSDPREVGDKLLAETDQYKIEYLISNRQVIVLVKEPPYDDSKAAAEQWFQAQGLSPQSLCVISRINFIPSREVLDGGYDFRAEDDVPTGCDVLVSADGSAFASPSPTAPGGGSSTPSATPTGGGPANVAFPNSASGVNWELALALGGLAVPFLAFAGYALIIRRRSEHDAPPPPGKEGRGPEETLPAGQPPPPRPPQPGSSRSRDNWSWALLAAGSSIVVAGALAFGLWLMLSSGDEDATESTRTVPTEPPPSTPTDTPEPLGRLEEVLGNGEFIAVRPLAKPNLIYAVKTGREVTVWERDIVNGVEQEVLTYVEPAEAQHSFNFWEELPPSATLSTDRELLVYTSADGVFIYDLSREESDVVALAIERQTLAPGYTTTVFGTNVSYMWETSGGKTLCCSTALVAPTVSADASWVVVRVPQLEGASLGIFALDGSAACSLPDDPPWVDSDSPRWSPLNELLIPSWGEFSRTGLFVVGEPDGCFARMIAADVEDVHLSFPKGFLDAAWSPDGEWVATSYWRDAPEGEVTDRSWSGITLMRRDGSDVRIINPEHYSLSPIFSPDGQSLLFVENSNGENGPQSLSHFDISSGRVSNVAAIPQGWSVRPETWTEEGYLMLSASSSQCPFKSCNNMMILLDVSNGGVVYASESSDFTRFLGLVN